MRVDGKTLSHSDGRSSVYLQHERRPAEENKTG